jgi:CheY-like chemotaxis protein
MAEIVLVDDDKMVCDTIKHRLERDGHQVRVALNGNEALKLVEQQLPDLVITDVIMPDREGIETLLALKKIAPTVKVVVMSGGGRIGRLEHLKIASALGADGTLKKPFKTSELRSLLAELL